VRKQGQRNGKGGSGRFSPVDKPRASPKPVEFGSMMKTPSFFVGDKGMNVDSKKVQNLEQKLKALLEKRIQIANSKTGKENERHDDGDLVDTPRISPTNIKSKGDSSRVRNRIARRDRLVKIDKKIQTLCNSSACNAPCICRVPNLLFYCRNSKQTSTGKLACITLRQQLLGKAQASIKKCVNAKTPQSAKILESWQQVKKEVESTIKKTTSFKNAESLYLSLSPDARANLSGLNKEELMAVQILIGSRMGLGPTKMNILPNLKKSKKLEQMEESDSDSNAESSDSDDSSEND